ncbi:MAG: hypothetical protein MJ009_00460 [Paludibacteraceae bacterium]|nr:hypothetical protein [Paludibacteraceae bacterium]
MIEVKKGVFYDKDAQHQSEEFNAWLHDEVYAQMATNKSQTEMVQPTYDKFGRPSEWVIDKSSCVVRVEREYVNPKLANWAMKKDVIEINTK